MAEPGLAEAVIESPCRKICTYDRAANLCSACGRNLREIGGWLHFSPEQRARIMAELPARLAKSGL